MILTSSGARFYFFILMVLALLFRSRGYLQAQPRLLVIQVPLFRLRIPYEMIENVRMAVYKDLVDSKTLPWGQRRLLTPALSQTVVQINVHKFPVPMFLLRLFLPNYLILPADRGKGLVVYVKQYLELTNEIDSRLKAERVDSAKSKPKARQDDEISLEGFFDLGT